LPRSSQRGMSVIGQLLLNCTQLLRSKTHRLLK
jgi:hypothetical protein